MVFLHINPKNYEEKNESGKTKIEQLNGYITDKNKKIFILFYMEGCGPCNQTRPEWNKIENILKADKDLKDRDDIIVVNIDQVLSDKVKNSKSPAGFPTMRFMTDGGNIVENYEDSEMSEEDKNRTIDSFVKWIKLKSSKVSKNGERSSMKGGKKRKTTKKRTAKKIKENKKKKNNKTKKIKTIKQRK